MSKKKADCPRFMIAVNPMAEHGEVYVYHSQQPRFLAKFVRDRPSSHFEIIDDIDDMIKYFNNDDKKIAGLLRRLGDWYYSYKIWGKENFNNEKDAN